MDKATGSNLAQQMRQDIDARKLKPHQMEIINGFYRARREAANGDRVPYSTLVRICSEINYEEDFAIQIMQKLDDELIRINNEKQQKEMERIESKKPR